MFGMVRVFLWVMVVKKVNVCVCFGGILGMDDLDSLLAASV